MNLFEIATVGTAYAARNRARSQPLARSGLSPVVTSKLVRRGHAVGEHGARALPIEL